MVSEEPSITAADATDRRSRPSAGDRDLDEQPRRSLTWLVSEDYARYTGGFVYNERLLAELGSRGWDIRLEMLRPGFPNPNESVRSHARSLLDRLEPGTIVLGDQICLCPLPDGVQANAQRLAFVVIAHHLMGRDHGMAADLAARERRVLPLARRIIAPSVTTAKEIVADCAVGRDAIVVAPPGLDSLPTSRGSGGDVPALLAMGALVPRKGYDALIRALARHAARPWTLTIVGDPDRAPAHVAELNALIGGFGLGERIALAGAVADVEPHWQGADLFIATSRHEGWGLAVAEAAARGLPILTTSAGAIAEWLDPTVAAIAPDPDGPLFDDHLVRLLEDAEARGRLGAAAGIFARSLPTWSRSAAIVDAALKGLAFSVGREFPEE